MKFAIKLKILLTSVPTMVLVIVIQGEIFFVNADQTILEKNANTVIIKLKFSD